MQVIERFVADERTRQCKSTVFVIMSHGELNKVYGTDGVLLEVERQIIYRFNRDNAPKLVGKPKLFIVQACRGGELTF